MKGIICALEKEAEFLTQDMKYVKKETVGGIKFTKGKLNGIDTVVAICGVGKVAAAMCAQTMILKYSPEYIINCGVAGTLTSSLHCGDIAVAKNVVQHDIDTSALGDPIGMISGINKTNIKCQRDLYVPLREKAEQLGFKMQCGVIASGDQFIAKKDKRKFLRAWFGAIACDMETAAIGQVCYINGVDFCAVRAISDEANGKSSIDYPTFLETAACNAAKVVKEFIGGAK